MESELPFGYAHRREKRSAAHMDLDGSASPSWSPIDGLSVSREATAPRTHNLPRIFEMPAEAPRRYQGDGYDFRRPVVSDNVIDLTDENAGPSSAPTPAPRQSHQSSGRSARPPRFGREIIDVEVMESSGSLEPPDSPEIEFVSARRIEPSRRRNPTPFERDNDEDEDEVEFLSENPLPESRRVANLLDEHRERTVHLRERMAEQSTNARRARDHIARMEHLFAASANRSNSRALSTPRSLSVRLEAPPRHGRARVHVGFIAPAMDFGAVGFDMGFNEAMAAPAPAPPTYNAPAQAPEGFTRSPQEEDVLVCPNCGDDLCTGDSDEKRQVWLVKGCGHVYCGECMANRHIKRSAKGKEKQAPARTTPFKECVVEGCQKRVSSKSAVIQVFL